MDTASTVLLVLGGITALLIYYWTSKPIAHPTIKESKDGATVEKCPYCSGVVGTSVKDSVSWRIAQKDTCPHCGKKIKR